MAVGVVSVLDIPRGEPWSGSGPCWGPYTNASPGRPGGAVLSCPAGHAATLDDHTIAADGTVTPSVVCPEDGCSWHVFARLVGWDQR